ncbi:MAG: HAD-IIB family hydrolase [Candidatus Binatia bacterium]
MTRSRLIIITDLDGSLLDQETYSYEATLPVIQRLLSLEIPLILCSSKTRSEIVRLWQGMKLRDPFIVENGGAIYCPARYFPLPPRGFKPQGSFGALELGTRVSKLRQVLMETARQCDARVRSFGSMGVDEVTALTGLARDQAALALKREYDEPFLVEGGDRERLFRALIGKGFTVTHGGRFFHLMGGHDKGKTVKILLDLYRRRDPKIMSVGLGNSANDFPLLSQVDRPILIRKPDGTWDREVAEKIPFAERTQAIGPNGWREAIEKILGDTEP